MARRQAAVEEPSSGHLIREAEAITGGVLALFLVLAFVSYYPDSPRSNLGGALGHNLAGGALQALGFPAYLLPVYLAYLTFALLRRDTSDLGGMRLAGTGVFVTALSSMGGLFADGKPLIRGGGWFGGFLGTALRDLFGGPGAFLVLAALLTVSLMMATGRSAFAVAQQGLALLREHGGEWLIDARERWTSWREGREAEPEPRPRKPRRAKSGEAIVLDEVVDDEKPARAKTPPPAPVRTDGVPPIYREPERRPEPPKKPVPRRFEGQEELFGPDTYRLPPLSLLDNAVRTVEPPDENTLLASARILETKLADFGVQGKVVAVRPGPVITTFEFEPAPGVKVARIVGLGEDLMMAMRAASVRVLAPIPGKPVVGVEVSNPRREKVFIKELLQSDEYRVSESKMTMALGKDTTGNPQVADLSRMPHLLIAGATGTGKSVSMNAMLMSILYKASPRDVRLIMIDPKMLELSIYENIPHLLVPVVTDPKKAAAALHNMIREMENRYRMLHDKGVRSLDSYNNLIAEGTAAAKKARDEERAEAAEAGEVDDEPPFDVIPNLGKTRGETPLEHRHLPRIVVIVDELADLMMTVGHEVEESITRLAQKARAAGIHLILATQRPSVDVITGLIKANFPARISFQTRSRPDSRTILDAIGAERLLGEGDMLFLSPTNSRLQRLHGPFVSDEDVHRVVDFIKKQEQPKYEMEFLEGGDEEEGGDGEFEEDMTDEMYDQGVHLVTKYRQASISWLQRKLRVGYNRAARMIERMEREGIVSAPSGPKGREVIAQAIPDDDEMIAE